MGNSETDVKTNERSELASSLVVIFDESSDVGCWAQMNYLRDINRRNFQSLTPPGQG